jgi:hypothetical protein
MDSSGLRVIRPESMPSVDITSRELTCRPRLGLEEHIGDDLSDQTPQYRQLDK